MTNNNRPTPSDYRTALPEKTPPKWKQHLIWLALTIDQMELDGISPFLLEKLKNDTKELELVLGKGITIAGQSNDEWEVEDKGTVKCFR